jgi:hypothetical protein
MVKQTPETLSTIKTKFCERRGHAESNFSCSRRAESFLRGDIGVVLALSHWWETHPPGPTLAIVERMR